MNHIYRSIWSEALNAWVAVSELTSAKGKRSGSSLLEAAVAASKSGYKPNRKPRFKPIESYFKPLALAVACCYALNTQANPIGAQVVNGTAAISQSGNLLTVTNSPNAIINWQGFSINSGETTRFIQQSASSAVLNRVLGADPSALLGTLTSNGRVFLVNPAGIMVGQGARIDVAGFVASTLNLSNADFLAGNLNFTNPSTTGGGAGEGVIQNNGTITTPEGGTVYLIAPQIENTGIITTPKGETILAAGNTVQLMDTGTPGVTVQVTGSDNTATNLGQILADSGRIGMVGAVVRNSGTISASSLVSEGGRIFLKATQRAEVTGTVTANSTVPSPSGGGLGWGSGGNIDISGPSVALGGTIAADGSTQGGNITIAAGGASLAGLVSATGGAGQGGSIDIQSETIALHNVYSTLDASGATGGSIRETAGQQITSSATYLAAGTAGNGGYIGLSAPATKLLSAQIDASGATGGGQIRVGGEFQGGKTPSPSASLLPLPQAGEGWGEGWGEGLPNAETLAISAGSTIKADATQQGNGGTVILWSDLESALYADVSAKGKNGAGGFIELSSAEKLLWGGSANASVGGQVLMDPKNIVIQDATAGGVQYNLTLGYNYLDLPRMKGNALEAGDGFGSAVSLSGTQLAVGALGDAGSGNAATQSGAVYLFSNPYTAPALSGIIGKGYTGAGNYDLAALEVNDMFGFSVSLSGTQLAVGARYDAGSGNVAAGSGAVYLFNNPFGTPTLSGVLGKGYTGAGNYDLTALEANDGFGSAVSLSGTQLAVGASGDAGSGNVVPESGAVYLFDNPYITPTLSGIIGKGYAGADNYDLTALEVGDGFGISVSLSGTQLAVGACGDNGSGNVAPESGAVYLFNNPFTTPALSGIIGKGYTGAGNYDLTALEAGDYFGYSVSLSGTQLAVGAHWDAGSGNVAPGSGAVYLFNTPFGTPALSGVIGLGYTGTGNYNLAALEAWDNFGRSVSLSGTQLAVGAMADGGSGNVATNSGAVYLFNNPFTTPTLSGIIGNGYTATGSLDPGNSLETGDQFGTAVSLSGTQLVVGAYADSGSGNVALNSGAVYLFNNPYTTPTLSGIIGKGYTGAGNYNLSTLEADQFGIAVSLFGTQLAVGAFLDDGFGNVASDSGAVYLFNDPFTTPTLSGIIGKGYIGAGDFNLTALEADDAFGSSVFLSGTQLAVGAWRDGGFGNSTPLSGAVYLFNNPYTTAALSGIIGKGYLGTGDYDLNALESLDRFGIAVSISGTQLAVGAIADDGFNNVAADSGAVYLFNNPFSTPTLSGTIGNGYVGSGDFNLSGLDVDDIFGRSVSLSGTQLAVGTPGDGGAGNLAATSGAVYLFNTPFNTPTLSGIIGKGYTGAGNYDLTALEAADGFGGGVSLSGTQLAVGAWRDGGSGNIAANSGAVYLFNNPFTTPTLSGIIGKGYNGAGNFDPGNALEAGDQFYAVSLSGTQLAVGALYDDGFGNAVTDSGAVYLFNNPYTTPVLSGIIGKGYTGAGNYDLTTPEVNDHFGISVSLSGTQLAVGANGDDGSGNLAPDSGAVYLFNNPFSATPTLSGTIGKGYTGAGNYDLTALANDFLGYSVSLSGTQLAVGANGDDGSGNLAPDSGAVYLFNNPFSATPTLSGIIGMGYSGAGDLNLATLGANDYFGVSVSLSGTQLAVVAQGDDGSGNAVTDSGAVYLFNDPFTAPALSGIIGNGYTGAGNYDLAALEANDYFGSAVSLSGTQLAVGAVGDDGSGNFVSNSGAVYLFNTPFSAPTLSSIIGKSYAGAGNYDLTALEANDQFGYAASLSGTQLAVGAAYDGGSGNVASNSGAVYLFTLVPGTPDPATGQTFSANPGTDSTITPASITAILDTGSALILQANNDITVTNAIITSAGGLGGDLTMQAGRSILVNANIDTDNGALTLIANDPGANLTYRDAGAAVLDTSLAALTAGSINLTNSGGDILAGAIAATAGNINLTASSNINIDAALTNTTGGNVLLRADMNGTGVGTITFGGSGSVALSGGGRADLYYNPIAYATPADYSAKMGATPYTAWMLVNDVTQLQAMNTSLAGAYALGKDVDATVTATWNTNAGFMPIGTLATKFTGQFDGLGHTVSNLSINRVVSSGHQGLFGWVGAGGIVSNVGLINPVIASGWTFGALAGQNDGTISNSYVSGGSVTGIGGTSGAWDIGGLVGSNTGTISNSYVSGGSVSANVGSGAIWDIGGLVGYNSGTISGSYASGGTVSASGSGSNMWAIGGLVGYSILGSTISNSSVISGSVSAIGGYVSEIGGLVGDNRGGINSSFVDNSISGSVIVSGASSVWDIGGLIGYNRGAISNSYVSGGSVSATVGGTGGSVSAVGGLVGYSTGTGSISNSFVSGSDVSGSGGSWVGDVGGLVGYNSGTIGNSYVSNGIVTGSSSVGGLAGVNRGTISNSYVSGGSVNGAIAHSGIGGLVGWNHSLGTISNSYSSNGVVGNGATSVGGLVGLNGGTVTDSFWDITTSGQATSDGGTGFVLTSDAMSQANYTGFDFTNTWWMSDTNTRPFLRSEHSTTITNAHQLQLMAVDLGASYTLGANISMEELANPSGMWDTTKGFVPVGNAATNFTGTFDGLKHTVSGLTINRPTPDYAGLFGAVGSVGIVRNVGLVGGSVSGSTFASNAAVGGLVGYNYGTISNSYNTGSVVNVGRSFAGGLVGTNEGIISNSYATGNVTIVESRAGGLVGHNSGAISNSYATGNVLGGCCANGGLVGHNAGSISNSYSTGSASGSYMIGGLVGEQSGSHSYSNNFWDITTSGLGGGYGATGLDTANMMTEASFTGAGWDFTNTWFMIDGQTRPFLRMEHSTTITNAHQLQLMAMDLTANYTLAANIDATATNGVTNPSGMWGSAGFVPVGENPDGGGSFIGTLDGANHVVSNLFINRPLGGDVALIGYLGGFGAPQGEVRNIGMSAVNITGGSNVGALVGTNNGTISNSYVSGANVTGTINVGGLVGANFATINNSHVSGGSVTGTTNNVGGLVGVNEAGSGGTGATGVPGNPGAAGAAGSNASISNSYVSGGTVSGINNIGGLVGLNVGGAGGWGGAGASITGTGGAGGAGGAATISNSYVSGGTVTGTGQSVGGLVGNNALGVAGATGAGLYGGAAGAAGTASISNTYVSGGSVDSPLGDSGWVGGLVGWNSGTITTSYASTGIIGVGLYGYGGFAGKNTGSITGNFWDIDTSGAGIGIDVGDPSGAVGIYSSTLTIDAFTQATYTGFDFGNTWWMSDTNTRPFLRSEYSTTITNAHQLQLMSMDMTANYTLGANIDAAETTLAGGMWKSRFIGWSLSGQFDGLNRTIDGLNNSLFSNIAVGSTVSNVGLVNSVIDASVSYEVGALAKINNGTINNSYALNPTLSGATYLAGGLVGTNNGTISNSYVSGGSISAGADVGGLAGINTGIITNSHVDSGTTVSAIGSSNARAGGMVGSNNGTISNSYVSGGSVSGGVQIGGLVGRNDGTISYSHVSGGTVSGAWYIGGLAGVNSSVISNSYVSGGNVSGASSVGGLVGYNDSNTNTTIDSSYVSGGTVSGGARIGGLVGYNSEVISNSHVQNVTVGGTGQVGGLVGYNGPSADVSYSAAVISSSYASGGSVSGTSSVGGLVGFNDAGSNNGSTISNSYVSNGAVSGSSSIGGLVGYNSGIIDNSHYVNPCVECSIIGSASVGGLVGNNSGTISTSYVSGGWVRGGTSSALSANGIGGLVGSNSGTISNSYVSGGTVTAQGWYAYDIGGLVGNNSGTIDSNSHAINMAVSATRSGSNMGGLVGTNGGTISNSYVSGGTVAGTSSNIGGLVGYNSGIGIITGSYVDNGTIVNGSSSVGGLVGYNSGSISNNSYVINTTVTGWQNIGGLVGFNATAGVSGTGSSAVLWGGRISNSYVDTGTVVNGNGSGASDIGGLVGSNNGVISNSYVSGGTVGGAYSVGGLVGSNYGTIDTSYVTNGVIVSGNTSVGGLVGYNGGGTVSNSYVSGGAVSGSSRVGGLVGYNSATIDNSYVSGGSVTGTWSVGGLVGEHSYNGGTVSNSHYNIDGTTDRVLINTGNLVTLGGLYDAQYQDWYGSGIIATGGLALNIADYSTTLPGSGGSYTITTVQGMKDLLGFADNSAYTFSLGSSVTLTSGLYIPYLAGSFDGAGFTLSDLDINQPNGDLGMFGVVDTSGTVSNLGLINSSVLAGGSEVGGLAGLNKGSISNSYVSGGTVSGPSRNVGGLVGWNYGGSISGSHVSGVDVVSTANWGPTTLVGVGGLAGNNSGSISNSYVSGGTVSGVNVIGAGGLVGINEYSGTISNSYGSGVAVSGLNNIGGLVGYNNGSISNNYVSGGTVTGFSNVGGLVGYNNNGGTSGTGTLATFWGAHISNSYVSGGTVIGSSSVGGLVGKNLGIISNTYVSGGSVTGTLNVGGLVGKNLANSGSPDWYYAGGIISSSYVDDGTITGNDNVGGLVGFNYGSISDTYINGGSVNGAASSSAIGGLVGYNSVGLISNSYVNTGVVSGYAAKNGALVGYNDGVIENSFWDGDTSALGGIGFDSGNGWLNGAANGMTTADMMTQANFDSATAANNWQNWGWDFTNKWWMSDTNTRPFLRSEWSNTITNAHQLQLMAMLPSASYVLADNLDLAAALDNSITTGMWSNAGFVPVGDGTTPFTGAFDGQNFTVSNLSINRASSTQGLFGTVGFGGVVSNVGLISPVIVGGSDVGGLAGFNNGTISNSYVDSGSITGWGDVGGLVGYNSGSISGSHVSNSFVSGSYGVGGLVGSNYGTIDNNSHVSGGSVAGSSSVGGLVGYNASGGAYTYSGSTTSFWGAYINSSYVDTGTVVSGSTNVGGLVGNNIGNISASYVSGGIVNGGTSSAYSAGQIGGLVGSNSGIISNSYVDSGSVTAVGGWYGASQVGGLAGYNTGNISGSHVNNSDVSGGSSASSIGGLVGSNTGTISTSYVSGGSVSGMWSVGGLAGSNYGTIDSNSHVSGGYVTGYGNVGGLVGYNASGGTYTGSSPSFWGAHVNFSYVDTGTVVNGSGSSSYDIGGLVGSNNGVISNSYVSGGSVSGNSAIGGLAGSNSGVIGNSYVSDGSVTGSMNVGGLVGYSWSPINNSYFNVDGVTINASNQVTLGGLYDTQFQDWFVGGLLIPLDIANYSASLVPAGGNNYTIGDVQGMKDLLGFADNPAYSFSLSANITLPSGLYIPYLAGSFNGSDGVNFYTISNLNINQPNSNLGMFGEVAVGGTVSNLGLLNANVTGLDNVGALAGWNDGNISNSNVSGGAVNGNYRIGGLVGTGGIGSGISNSSVSNVGVSGLSHIGGLLGYSNGGGISNSYVDSGNVTGGWSVGGLLGHDGGEGTSTSIVNSHVSNSTVSASGAYVGGLAGYFRCNMSLSDVVNTTVSGDSYVGGLVGYNGYGGTSGTGSFATYWGAHINSSYVDNGTITGSNVVGGLVGYNTGVASNTYVNGGSVSGATSAGGLAGISSGRISNSYANTGVVGATNIGALVGYNSNVIENSFWDSDTSPLAGIGFDWTGGTGLAGVVAGMATTGMMSMTGFANAAWDIANTGGAGTTWRIYEGSTTPLLSSFLTPLTATAIDDSKTYDGLAYSGGNGVTYSDVNAVPGVNVYEGSLVYGGASQSAVNAGGYTIGASGLYSGQQGYDISYVDGALTVNQKVVSLSGSKEYDGTATFTGGTNLSVTTGVGTETLALTGTALTLNKNVGNTDLIDSLSLGLSDGTGLASNYTLTGAGLTGVVSITPLALSGAVIAAGGSTYASALNPGAVSFANIVGSDVVTSTASVNTGATSGSGNFVAGSYTQTASGLGGADAANYSFAGFTSSANYIISPLTLTGAAIAAANTTYGTPAANGAVTFGNAIALDAVGTTASTTAPLLSTSGNLKAGGYTQTAGALSGADAANYSFAGFTSAANYSVAQLALTGSITSGSSTYGSTLAPGAASFTNAITNDLLGTAMIAVNTTGNTSTSGNLRVGSYTGIESVSALSGADAGNYTFSGVLGNYTVNALALAGSITAGSSTYGSTLAPGTASFTNAASGDALGTATVAVNTSGNTSTSGNLRAGSYTGIESVSALSGADAGNYTFSSVLGNYTVGQLALTGAAIAAVNATYGTPAANGAVTFGNAIAGDAVSSTASINSPAYSTSGNLNAGSYTQTASTLSGADAGNYSFAGFTSAANYSVAQLALTGSITAGTSTYGSTLAPGTATFTNAASGDALGTATIAVNTTGNTSSSGNLRAGSYTGIESVSALSGADAGNYTFSGVLGNYTVGQLALTGAAIAAANTTYGTPAANGAVTFGNAIALDVVGTTASTTAPLLSTSGNLNAGSYTQTAGALSGADAGNYSFAGFTSAANYSVAQLSLTGAAIAAVNTTYGTPAANGAVTFGNAIALDVVGTTASTTAPLFSTSGNLKAGSYTQTAGALSGADAGNYSFAGFTSAANYSVAQLALTGAAIAAANTTYGTLAANGAVTFGNAIALDAVGTTASTTTPLLSTSGNLNAGSYMQTAGALAGADAANYSFAGFTSAANYSVAQLALTGAAIAGVTATYGTPAANGAVTFGNAIALDVVGTTASTTTPLLSTSGNLKAGSYTQTASTLSGTDAGNYSFAGFTSAANYTITPLALTGSITAGTSTYGSTLAPGTATFTNAVSGDALGTATVAVNTTGNTSTSGNLRAGSYTGIESVSALSGADAGNYTFSGVLGNYTVGQLALSGSITAGSSTYGSTLASGTASFTNAITNDLLGTAMIAVNTNGNTSTSGNLRAGSYTGIESVSALSGADAGNYTFAGVVGDYTVNTRPITLTVNPGQGKTYGQFDLAMIMFNDTAGTMQVVAGDTLMGGITRAAGENAGIYAIGQGGLTSANNPNYNITFVGNNFTINPALLSIVANPHTKVYGSADPVQSFAANGHMQNAALGIDDVAASAAGTLFSGAMTRPAGENVGAYTLALGTLSAGGNYTITSFTSNGLTITPATLTYTANAASRAYGSANPALSGSVTGFVLGQTVATATTGTESYTTAALSTDNVGSYAITGSGLAANNGNYIFTQAAGNATALTITPDTLPQDVIELITLTTINPTTDSTVTDPEPVIIPPFVPPPPPDTTGANLLKTTDPFGGNIGGAAGTFGSTDTTSTSAPASESGTAATDNGGSEGGNGNGDTASADDDKKDRRAAKKDGEDGKDKKDKDDKNKGKSDEKPKC